MKTDRKAEPVRKEKAPYKVFKPPHHFSGPCYSGPPRNPLIPPALCALDSFMSSLWEMVSGHRRGGMWEKKSHMSLAMKKYAHTFSIQILQGQNRGDGHMSGAALWLCGVVAACACSNAHMFMGKGLFFFLLNGPVFSHLPVCTSAVTIVILMIPP